MLKPRFGRHPRAVCWTGTYQIIFSYKREKYQAGGHEVFAVTETKRCYGVSLPHERDVLGMKTECSGQHEPQTIWTRAARGARREQQRRGLGGVGEQRRQARDAGGQVAWAGAARQTSRKPECELLPIRTALDSRP